MTAAVRSCTSASRWRAVLFDADDVLLDYPASEREALLGVLHECGVDGDHESLLAAYRRHNAAVWRAFERGELSQQDLRTERFVRLAAELGAVGWDVRRMSQRYLDLLSATAHVIEGAESLVEALAESYPLGIVTNGIARVQRGRFSRIPFMRHFPHVVISEEVHVAKPDPRIFDGVLAALALPAREVLFVGDSTTSDMPAAHAAGIDFCWYNPAALPVPPGYAPVADVRTLGEIADMLL